jgi:hypothetical protein
VSHQAQTGFQSQASYTTIVAVSLRVPLIHLIEAPTEVAQVVAAVGVGLERTTSPSASTPRTVAVSPDQSKRVQPFTSIR